MRIGKGLSGDMGIERLRQGGMSGIFAMGNFCPPRCFDILHSYFFQSRLA